MASFTALYDACVLYPAPLRDLLLRLARTELFRARWSDRIHDEWINAVLRTRPELRDQLQRTRLLMDRAVPDCLVRGYEPLINGLTLPDENDRHVLAAAIVARAGVIVTYNLSDFPDALLESHGISPQHPDAFIHHLIDLAPGSVCFVVREHRAALKNPPKSVEDYLDTLSAASLPQTVATLRQMVDLL